LKAEVACHLNFFRKLTFPADSRNILIDYHNASAAADEDDDDEDDRDVWRPTLQNGNGRVNPR
jgi:hypothetical protein